jgi:hypothetical protein
MLAIQCAEHERVFDIGYGYEFFCLEKFVDGSIVQYQQLDRLLNMLLLMKLELEHFLTEDKSHLHNHPEH